MADILPFQPPGAPGAPSPGGSPPQAGLAALLGQKPNPALAQAPGQIGAGVTPQMNMGSAVKAMSDVRNAVKMLESALPNIPMGSPLHSEVLNSTKSLLKHLSAGDGNSGLDLMSLIQMARSASQAQPMQALMKAFPGQQNTPPALGPAAAASPSPMAA